MEQFSGSRFQGIAWLLGFTHGLYQAQPPTNIVDRSVQDGFATQLEKIRTDCEGVGLQVSAIHLAEEIRVLKKDKALTCSQFADIALGLSETVRREMRSRKLFRLSEDTQRYFERDNPFGEIVSKAFPSAEYDIREAGNCLALSRATACVFHCMRALEHGLVALALKFNVPVDQPSWNEMIERTENKIRSINKQKNKPANWKDDEQFYSEAASQFMHFKNAWRNYTAHAQFKYTEDEAEAIYRHVRDFMKHIAKRLKE